MNQSGLKVNTVTGKHSQAQENPCDHCFWFTFWSRNWHIFLFCFVVFLPAVEYSKVKANQNELVFALS